MNYKSKHSRLIRAVEGVNIKNCIEELAALEHILQAKTEEDNTVLMPLEANFQLPNVFLKTKINNKVQRLFDSCPSSPQNDLSLEEVIEFLSDIEIYDVPNIQIGCFDESILEDLIRFRFSTSK